MAPHESVRSLTIPATSSRFRPHTEGRSPRLGQRERVAPGEAFLGEMPPADVVLPELPAELDLAAEMNSREVDQPPGGVTKDDPQFLESVQDGLNASAGPRDSDVWRDPRDA